MNHPYFKIHLCSRVLKVSFGCIRIVIIFTYINIYVSLERLWEDLFMLVIMYNIEKTIVGREMTALLKQEE